MTKSSVFLRLLLLIIILGPITYIGFLNQAYFLETTSLHLELKQPEQLVFSYDTPELSNAFYWTACLFLGMLIAALRSLPKQLNARKQIRQLSATEAAQREEIASLKADIAQRDGVTLEASQANTEHLDPADDALTSVDSAPSATQSKATEPELEAPADHPTPTTTQT